MTLVRRTYDLPYRPEDVFELVSDVRRYPEFVKWLQALRVTKESRADRVWSGEAEVSVGFKSLSERFVTLVRAVTPAEGDEAPAWTVEATLLRGPFRRLRNQWRVTPADAGSRAEFLVDFEFRNPILQAVAGANLDAAVKRLVEAFAAEAERRYMRVDG